jgi:4-carboxymuconolactone decarboxylase
MSRLPALRRDRLDESAGALFDLIVSTRSRAVIDEDGGLRGPFNPWLYAPDLGRRAAELGWHLRSDSSVERRLLELAIITTGARWKSEFEWWAHAPMAREHGIADDVIDAIGRGTEPPITRDDERAVYRAAKQLSEAGHLDADTYAAAHAAVGDRGMVELVSLVGYYSLVSFTLNAFEIVLPPGASPTFSVPGDPR